MKAMMIEAFGDADLLRPTEVDRPIAGPGQVLVEVAATSVNTADVKARELGHALDFVPDLPAVLGMDVAGRVAALGEGVTGFAVGDAVFGCAGGVRGHGGALAQFLVADARLLARKPETLSMAEAAALPLVAITAYEALVDRMDVRRGQTVLIHGGAGGVGHVAIQIATALGAQVYATGSARARDVIEGLGATFIDYMSETPEAYVERLTDGRGFDAVFDTVGAANIETSFRAAKLNGQVATTVSLCELDLTLAHVRGLTLHVIYMLMPMLHGVGRERHGAILRAIATLVDRGALRPILDETFPLDAAADAHRRLESGQTIGKVVIEVAAS
ncbi:MAG: zinc-dependent alcohol dehydrogenase family protein [Pseudomonadota bacterium]